MAAPPLADRPARVETLVPRSNSFSQPDKIFWIIFCLRNEFRVIGSSKENLSSGFGEFMLKPSKSEWNVASSEMWTVWAAENGGWIIGGQSSPKFVWLGAPDAASEDWALLTPTCYHSCGVAERRTPRRVWTCADWKQMTDTYSIHAPCFHRQRTFCFIFTSQTWISRIN